MCPAASAAGIDVRFLPTWKHAVGPAFPRAISCMELAVAAGADVLPAATMPFYQLVCIAAHYPEYVCAPFSARRTARLIPL